MQKRFVWAIQLKNDRRLLHRFSWVSSFWLWLEEPHSGETRFRFNADTPEVRRIQRRIAQGEQITFPVEIN